VDVEKKHGTVKISIAVSVILSIAIILVILKLTISHTTLEYLTVNKIQYEYFLAAIFLNIMYWFLWGTRLKMLCTAVDKKMRMGIWGSTKIVLANLFLAGITPSMAGGEPVRIYLLNKNGMSIGGATAAVLGERLLDAMFILICIPFAFFVFKNHIDVELIRTGLSIGVIVFVACIILFVYAIKNPDKTKSFLIFLESKLRRFFRRRIDMKKVVDRINREVDDFNKSMKFFAKKGRKTFLLCGVLTVLFWSTGFMIPSMILLGLGLDPFIVESYSAQVLLLVIVMMPTTPGSSGITEGSVAGLYSVLIGRNLIGVFVLLFRLITYYMNLIVGAIFQYKIFRSVASFSLDMIKK